MQVKKHLCPVRDARTNDMLVHKPQTRRNAYTITDISAGSRCCNDYAYVDKRDLSEPQTTMQHFSAMAQSNWA